MSGTRTTLDPARIASILADLGIAPSSVRSAGERGASVLVALEPGAEADARAIRSAASGAAHDGWLLVHSSTPRNDVELARLRDGLWPDWHVSAIYRGDADRVTRRSQDGARTLSSGVDATGIVVAARRPAHVLAPDATVLKFDKNAAGWNGAPGRPGYGHFRWMRRFVADFAGEHSAQRILDFGSGAGWVGIEAALASQARGGTPELAVFDPSPELIRIAEENARSAGVTRCVGRTGFGEDPPFPAAGEAPFDLVISSGVVSFAADRARWFDGLARTVAPGGTLVIGDIHPGSKGMRRRRREKPLLPIREMNGIRREEARAELERRGFRFEAWSGYQLSDPVPQWNHLDATRLKGLLGPALLAWNRRAARKSAAHEGADQDRFDSWVIRATRRSDALARRDH